MPDREPDEIQVLLHKGSPVYVHLWWHASEGTPEEDHPLAEATEGLDLFVLVQMCLHPNPADPSSETFWFSGRDAVEWFVGGEEEFRAYMIREMVPNAIESLEAELARVSSGEDVTRALRYQAEAKSLIANLEESSKSTDVG